MKGLLLRPENYQSPRLPLHESGRVKVGIFIKFLKTLDPFEMLFAALRLQTIALA